MPKILDPSTSELAVPRLSSSVVQLPTVNDPGIGQGLTNFGGELEHAARVVSRMQRIEQDRADKLRAEEAVTTLRTRQMDLTYGEQNGYENLKGSSATTRPILPEWTSRFDDAQKEISDGLVNDRQRAAFKAAANVSRLQLQDGIMRHIAREGDVYAKEVYDGVVQSEQQNAAAHYASPSDVGVSLVRIQNAVDERAERYGWAPEYHDLVLRQEQGKVHAAVVQQAIANGDNAYAEEWFNHNRDNIDAATSKTLAVAVENGAQKDLTNKYNAQYLSNEDSMPALESLRKEVLGDEGLGEDRRNVLVGRIQNRQSVLDNRLQVLEHRRLRAIEHGLNELNSNTLAGFEPAADKFLPLIEASKGTELEAQAHAALQLAGATREFRNSPPLVQEQMLTNAETALRQDPTKFDRNVLGAWRTIHDAQRQQAQESPITFAVRQGIIEPPTPIDLSKPEDTGRALSERFAIARGVSARYQTPLKPLTTDEVRLLQSSLSGANAEQKRDYLGKLSVASGSDSAGYMAIMAQLAPDDPVTAIAGARSGRGDNLSADLMLRGQTILHPPTKSDGKPDTGSLLPMPPEQDMRSHFDNTVRDAFAGKPDQRSAHYQAAKAVYAALSVDAGDRDTKTMNADRWDEAIRQSVGPIEKYNGRRVVMPSSYEYSQFRDEVNDRIDQMLSRSLTARTRSSLTAKMGGAIGSPDAPVPKDYELDPAWTQGRLRDLPLENVGDGRYVFRSGDGVVSDVHGRPVVLDFNVKGPAKASGPSYSEALMGIGAKNNGP